MQKLKPISIWRPETIDGSPAFVRPAPGPFGDHYSDRLAIPLETPAPRRVCFFGESAAAGYLLAPDITPAGVLGLRLGPDYDVVDLARTNERIDTLVDTIQAALQLRPDVLVVFAGNNWNLLETPDWSPFFPVSESRQRYAAAVRRGGLGSPVLEAQRALRVKVDRLFDCLLATGTRTVIVVPEVNLADWTTRQPVPWLDEGLAAWYRLLVQAERALRRRDFAEARMSARRMLTLDGGSCPTAFRLLARAAEGLGDRDEAATASRAHVDSAHYPLLALLGAPQARHADQEMLADGARRAGFDCVDLREVFADGFGKPPGRALFYDYCHLTPHGINLAMSAVASAIAGDAGGGPIEISASVATRAAIGAAIHGVHRGARGPVVRHWMRAAIAEGRAARQLLRDVVDARLASAPAVLTKGQLRDDPLTPQQGWKWKWLDAETLAAIEEVTGLEVLLGDRGAPKLELWNPLDRFLSDALDHDDAEGRATYRAPWPWTHLALLARGPCTIEMVVRGKGTARLRSNGQCISRLQLRPQWTRWRVHVTVQPARRDPPAWRRPSSFSKLAWRRPYIPCSERSTTRAWFHDPCSVASRTSNLPDDLRMITRLLQTRCTPSRQVRAG